MSARLFIIIEILEILRKEKKRKTRGAINKREMKTQLSIGIDSINNPINYITSLVKISIHKEHRQQHLKSNNIITKLAVIVLSIVLLTGISLVPALQIGVNGQVQQQ
jgi:hypothetical protein